MPISHSPPVVAAPIPTALAGTGAVCGRSEMGDSVGPVTHARRKRGFPKNVSAGYDLVAFRYRLYPNPAQVQALRQMGGCRRLVYNWGLEQRNAAWAESLAAVALGQPKPKGLTYIDQQNALVGLKKARPFLKDAPSHCLQAALRDLDSAFAAFFKGHAQHPTFAKHRDGVRLRFPDPQHIRLDGATGQLVLPKFGRKAGDHGALRIRVHRPLVGALRRVSVREDGGQWYASVVCRTPIADRVADGGDSPCAPSSIVGCDRGAVHPCVTSQAVSVGVARSVAERQSGAPTRVRTRYLGQPVETAGDRAHMATLQRRLARKSPKSKNWHKAQRALRRHAAKVRRRRQTQVCTMAKAVVRSAGVVAFEALPLVRMTKSAQALGQSGGAAKATTGKNRRMADPGLGMLVARVGVLTKAAGTRVVAVNPAFTSRTCPRCGDSRKANRVSRDRFCCQACGLAGCADAVASVNIKRKAHRVLALEAEAALCAGGCPEDTHRGTHGTGLGAGDGMGGDAGASLAFPVSRQITPRAGGGMPPMASTGSQRR